MTPRVRGQPSLSSYLHHALHTSARSVDRQPQLPNGSFLQTHGTELGGLRVVIALAGSWVGALANGTVPGTWQVLPEHLLLFAEHVGARYLQFISDSPLNNPRLRRCPWGCSVTLPKPHRWAGLA